MELRVEGNEWAEKLFEEKMKYGWEIVQRGNMGTGTGRVG